MDRVVIQEKDLHNIIKNLRAVSENDAALVQMVQIEKYLNPCYNT